MNAKTRIFLNTTTKPGLGFTTNMFANTGMKIEDVIRWAEENGFSWAEVRDPNVKMSDSELINIKKLAVELNMELHYAWDSLDLLNFNEEEFYKGVSNAKIFGKGTYSRVVIAPNQIKNVAGKKGYTKEEYLKIIDVMNKCITYSEREGIELCFENAFEPVNGDKSSFYGMSELLDGCKPMKSTFDAGNFMNKNQTRVNPSQEELIQYIRKYHKQLPYIHIKLTRNNEIIPTLEGNVDFDIKQIFDEFTVNPKANICLELPGQNDENVIKDNILKSINYLIEVKTAILA